MTYYMYKSIKELWDILEPEYGWDGARIENFNALNANKFIMVDDNLKRIKFMSFKIILYCKLNEIYLLISILVC